MRGLQIFLVHTQYDEILDVTNVEKNPYLEIW